MNPRIQILIKEQTVFGEYNDALYYNFSDFYNPDGTQKMDQSIIDEAVAARVSSYVSSIQYAKDNPQPEVSEGEIIAARVQTFRDAISTDEPVVNGILDAAMQLVPVVENREELRAALLRLGE